MERYYSIRSFARIAGLTPQTLKKWDQTGRLRPHHTSADGYCYYSHEQLDQLNRMEDLDRITIGYCRISSPEQGDELRQQVEQMRLYLLAQGRPFQIIQDIGSGVNYRNRGLLNLIERINDDGAAKVVIPRRDGLVRVGFELVETIARLHNCKIEVIDQTELVDQQELMQDMIQVMSNFREKFQGERAEQIQRMIQELERTT